MTWHALGVLNHRECGPERSLTFTESGRLRRGSAFGVGQTNQQPDHVFFAEDLGFSGRKSPRKKNKFQC